MNDDNIITASIDAALRGKRNFFSKNAARGNSTIENKQENINGERISLPIITNAPIAKRLTNTQANFT